MVLPVDDWSRDTEPPPIVVEAKASLTSAELGHAIGVDFAERGVQLAELGVRITYTRDANGEWLARVQDRAGACDTSVSLGRFDELTPARRRLILTSLDPLLQICSTPLPPRTRAQARWVPPVAGLLGVASGAGLVGLAFGHSPNVRLFGDDAASVWMSSGLSTVFAASTATFFVPRAYQPLTLQLGYFSGVGMLSAGLASAEPKLPSYGFYSLAAGNGATALLLGLDAVVSKPRYDGARDHSIPSFIRYAPAVVGSFVSAIPAFQSGATEDDRGLILLTSGGTLVPAIVSWIIADTSVGEAVRVGGGPRGSIGLSVGGNL
jgi:hypothetical protein